MTDTPTPPTVAELITQLHTFLIRNPADSPEECAKLARATIETQKQLNALLQPALDAGEYLDEYKSEQSQAKPLMERIRQLSDELSDPPTSEPKEPCPKCDDTGWVQDDLSLAAGGSPAYQCDCQPAEPGKVDEDAVGRMVEKIKSTPTGKLEILRGLVLMHSADACLLGNMTAGEIASILTDAIGNANRMAELQKKFDERETDVIMFRKILADMLGLTMANDAEDYIAAIGQLNHRVADLTAEIERLIHEKDGWARAVEAYEESEANTVKRAESAEAQLEAVRKQAKKDNLSLDMTRGRIGRHYLDLLDSLPKQDGPTREELIASHEALLEVAECDANTEANSQAIIEGQRISKILSGDDEGGE